MGGFANLKKDFEKHIEEIETEDVAQSAFQYMLLRTLFEIAGNLDTIAVAQRKMADDREAMFNDVKEQVIATVRAELKRHA